MAKGNDPLIYFWTSYTNSDAGSNGAAVVVTTRTVTDSTTAITTLPFDPTVDKTKTIEVIEPIPTTTITTSYVGISTSLSTKTATIEEQQLLLLMFSSYNLPLSLVYGLDQLPHQVLIQIPLTRLIQLLYKFHCQIQQLQLLSFGQKCAHNRNCDHWTTRNG